MKLNKFLPKPLPRYFFGNIIQLENAILTEPTIFDIKSLCKLYQRALEYYSCNQNMLMRNAYQKKLKDLTENPIIISLMRNPTDEAIYILKKPDYEDLRDRVNQRMKNEQIGSSLFINESNDIINNFNNCLISGLDIITEDMIKQSNQLMNQIKNKKNSIKKQGLLASAEKVTNDCIQKQQSSSDNIREEIIRKRKNSYNPSTNNNSLIQMITMEKTSNSQRLGNKERRRQTLESIFETNLLDKINYICQGMYDQQLNDLHIILEKMYDDKLIISLDHIEAMKEIDLMYQDAKEESEKIMIEKMKETMQDETNKKNNELSLKFTKTIDRKKMMIANEKVSDNEQINSIADMIFDNVIRAITI